MKNHYLPVSLALLVGVGIGWLVKPAGETAPTATQVSRETKIERPQPAVAASEATAPDHGRTKPAVRTLAMGSGQEIPKEAREMQDKMATAMADSQRKKDDRQIAELVEKLGLDAAQQAKLTAFFEKRRAAITGMFSGDGSTPPDFKAMGDDQLDKLMAATLTADQGKTYAALKEAERNKKVESQALKDLAKLNSMIDLRPDQKDAVYQILCEDAGTKVDNAAKSGMGGMMAMMGGDLGVDLDMDTLGIHDSIQVVGEEGAPATDGASIRERILEQQQKRTDAQVKRMESVLDAKQLEAYRERLETKGSMFGSMIAIPDK